MPDEIESPGKRSVVRKLLKNESERRSFDMGLNLDPSIIQISKLNLNL
jgi:hypothetical protein